MRIDYIEIYNEHLKGVLIKDLAKKYGIHRSTLSRNFRELGLKTFNIRNPHSFNYNYFKNIDTKSKAYFLGLIHSDGCLSDNYGLSLFLQIEDLEIIKKFRHHLESTSFIQSKYLSDSNRKPQCGITVYSKVNYNNLINHGITPRKSKKLFFPNITKELIPHFIRGSFDGDGCLSISKYRKSNRYQISMLGTKEYISKLNIILKEYYYIDSKIYPRKECENLYVLRIIKKSHLVKFYNLIYQNSDGLYIDRKFNKWNTPKNDDKLREMFRDYGESP